MFSYNYQNVRYGVVCVGHEHTKSIVYCEKIKTFGYLCQFTLPLSDAYPLMTMLTSLMYKYVKPIGSNYTHTQEDFNPAITECEDWVNININSYVEKLKRMPKRSIIAVIESSKKTPFSSKRLKIHSEPLDSDLDSCSIVLKKGNYVPNGILRRPRPGRNHRTKCSKCKHHQCNYEGKCNQHCPTCQEGDSDEKGSRF